MPELKKLESAAAFTPASGNIVEYFAEENGSIVLKVKKSDGTVATLSGGGGGGSSVFDLVKVTEYTPYRAALTATEKVVISGMGTVESEWGDSADFSDINGSYIVTDETKYLSGLKRVYKQDGGKYYIRCYDPDDYEYPDYGVYWCITQHTYTSRWESKAVYDGSDIPSGTNTWYSEMVGSVSIPTEVTNTTYPEQPLVLKGKKVESYDEDDGTFNFSQTEENLYAQRTIPKINAIYSAFNGVTIVGQPITRVLDIPSGFVRNFKVVDGKFIDTIGGTEMSVTGDVSFDFGYSGIAPQTQNVGYLSAENNLEVPNDMTIMAVFKPNYGSNGLIFGYGGRSDDQAYIGINCAGVTYNGEIHYFDTHINYGKWNICILTRSVDGSTGNISGKFYTNGKSLYTREPSTSGRGNNGSNWIGVMADKAVFQSSGTVTGQIDTVCIWNRVLTDDEISLLSKAFKNVG